MPVTIEPFGLADDLAPADLGLVVEVFTAVRAEWNDRERPMSEAGYCDLDRLTHPPEVVHRRLARDRRGAVVGFGQVHWRDGEPGASVARVFVAPDQRRAGVGTALGADLAAVARAAGRTGMTFEAAVGSVADSICERAGLRGDMVVEINEAAVGHAPDALLDEWVATGEAADGYSLVRYDGRCPDELAAGFVEARHVMNDAPRHEGEPEAHYTVAELRAAEAACAAAHEDWWNIGVRHDASGAIVGLTEMYLPAARPWIGLQGDTGVDRAHRGHRLGAWMKAVNHLRLRRERPEVDIIQTWNAASNEPMLRINRALGFAPVQSFRGWYAPFA